MPSTAERRIAPTSPEAPSRVIVRASADFLVRGFAEGIRAYGSLRRALLLNAIITANVQHITRSAVQNWRYGRLDQAPPNAERRPVSIKRLAESVGAPFETTRSHVQGLIDSGLCRRESGGLIVPTEVLLSEAVAASNRVLDQSFWRMIDELKALNFDFAAVTGLQDLDTDLVLEPGFQPGAGAADRVIARLTAQYYLDAFLAGAIICEGDWLDTAVFGAMMSLNTDEMAHAPERAWLYSRADTPPPDAVRRGARIAEVATVVCMDKESARRRVRAMQAKGWVDAGEGGFYASMSHMQSPQGRLSAMEVTKAFYRMIHNLTVLRVVL